MICIEQYVVFPKSIYIKIAVITGKMKISGDSHERTKAAQQSNTCMSARNGVIQLQAVL
jgi:hypothetical protein